MTVRTTSLLGREQKKQVTADCSDAVRTLLSNTSILTKRMAQAAELTAQCCRCQAAVKCWRWEEGSPLQG